MKCGNGAEWMEVKRKEQGQEKNWREGVRFKYASVGRYGSRTDP